jgi:hypothetical protein
MQPLEIDDVDNMVTAVGSGSTIEEHTQSGTESEKLVDK